MRGWHKESYRHYLAGKGIKTNRYSAKKPKKGLFVPATIDWDQRKRKFKTPEIRVWFKGKDGAEYKTFESFDEAESYIKLNPGAERLPLVAMDGYEINLYDMKQRKYLALKDMPVIEIDELKKDISNLRVTKRHKERYASDPEYRLRRIKYNVDFEKRLKDEDPEEFFRRRKQYVQTYKEKYPEKIEEFKKYLKEDYFKRPEVMEAHKQQMKDLYLKNREARLAYQKKYEAEHPELAEKKKEYLKEYNQRPEVVIKRKVASQLRRGTLPVKFSFDDDVDVDV